MMDISKAQQASALHTEITVLQDLIGILQKKTIELHAHPVVTKTDGTTEPNGHVVSGYFDRNGSKTSCPVMTADESVQVLSLLSLIYQARLDTISTQLAAL